MSKILSMNEIVNQLNKMVERHRWENLDELPMYSGNLERLKNSGLLDNIAVIKIEDVKREFPEFYQNIMSARAEANAASSLYPDFNKDVDYIVLQKDAPIEEHNMSFDSYGEGKSLMYFSIDYVRDFGNMENVRRAMVHEWQHGIQHLANELDYKNSPPSFSGHEELNADRAVKGLDEVEIRLEYFTSENYKNWGRLLSSWNNYNRTADHPSDRARVLAALRKEFGDSVFGFNGNYLFDEFQTNKYNESVVKVRDRFDAIEANKDLPEYYKKNAPITEDGRVVLFYDQTNKDADVIVGNLMSNLDSLVKSGGELTKEEFKKWFDGVKVAASEFNKTHQPVFWDELHGHNKLPKMAKNEENSAGRYSH